MDIFETYDEYGEDEGPAYHAERVRLSDDVWMVLCTWPDNSAVLIWEIRQPGGGFRIGGLV